MANRICFFPGALGAGGVARNAINLAEEFLDNGYEVDFFLTYKEGELLEAVPSRATIFSANKSAKMSLFSFVKYLKERKPVAVISARDYLNIAAYFGIKLSGVKSSHIATIRTSTFTERENQKKAFTYVENWLATLVYKRTNHVVAVSDSVLKNELIKRKLKVGAIKKIYNPVVPKSLLECSVSYSNSLSGHAIPHIVAVGRLTKQKDFSTLIKAVKILYRENYDIKVSIIGHGELKDALVGECVDYGLDDVIEFRGALPTAWESIAGADLLVQTSLWEGLPTVLIEALALGTNVVATDCPGGASEILEDGKYGFLAEKSNPESVAKAIQEALEKPMSADFLKSRALDFTSEKSMRRYEALFKN